MDCQEIKKLIPIYLDQELGATEHQQVKAHLHICPDCRAEARLLEKSWDLLGEIKAVEPHPNYMSRFWRSVDEQMPWYAKIFQNFQEVWLQHRWVPALAGAAIVVLISTVATVKFLQHPQAVPILADLNATELEMVVNFDLAEDLDIIKDIEFFSDLEIIESLNGSETS